MPQGLNQLFAAADWKELTPRLLYFADNLIRQCVWRGQVVTARRGAKLCVEGFGADDILQEAIDRLLNGRRSYNYAVPLEQNLKGAIRSILWSLNKSSLRKPQLALANSLESQEGSDAIVQVPDSSPSFDAQENARQQQRILAMFEHSLGTDQDLRAIFNAYKEDVTKPREIEALSGIPAGRVSELKRKLRERMEEFEAKQTRESQ